MGKENTFVLTKPLNHIAFIMDGNGRWAKKRLLPRSMGHKAGVANVKKIANLCFKKYGIRVVSLFVFSTENWNRPDSEISFLFQLLGTFFRSSIDEFLRDGTKIVVSGDLSDPRIPKETLEDISSAVERTAGCTRYVFNVLFNYGGRRELAEAARKIASEAVEGKLKIEDIGEKTVASHLYHPELPDVDLLVRTSGELRVSNCLLWEDAYAEMTFPKTYWPDFDEDDLVTALKDYESRNRRFGGIQNE